MTGGQPETQAIEPSSWNLQIGAHFSPFGADDAGTLVAISKISPKRKRRASGLMIEVDVGLLASIE